MRVLSLAVLTGLTSAVWATSAASVVSDLTLAERGCSASDARLLNQRKVLCHSLTQGPTPWCGDDWRNVSASEDWPNQAIYMLTLLRSLATPTTCLNTSYSRSTVAWLDTEMASTAISGNFMNTWLVFQLQYYDMPRLPGTRIESPDTLGRKCWAMAYLTQQWADIASPLERRLATAGLSAANFTAAYERAMPLTMGICQKVICNCFKNASYDPTRSGGCPLAVREFHYLGFDHACDADGFPVGGASFKPEFKDIVTAISAAKKS